MAAGTILLTAEEYAELPAPEGCLSELVRGAIVTMNPARPRYGEICAQICYLLRRYLDDHPLGRVLTNASGVITERNPDTVRGADVAYYSFQRVPKGPLPAGLLDVTPDLVFEVLSPSDRWSEVQTKVAEYLDAGVHVVCVVDDGTRSVYAFGPDQPMRVFRVDDELDLPEVLGGFHVPVSRCFESD